MQPFQLATHVQQKYGHLVGVMSELEGIKRRKYIDAIWSAIHETDSRTIEDDLDDLKRIEIAFDMAQQGHDFSKPL